MGNVRTYSLQVESSGAEWAGAKITTRSRQPYGRIGA
jgi:hypothetical protein